jgi:predicted DNA-binding transcriptional regulator AlpA
MDIFLTEIQIFEMTGFTKTQLFQMIEAGDFPKPEKTERINKWLESEVLHWFNTRNLHISR